MRLPLLCLLAVLFVASARSAEPPPQGERHKAKGAGAPVGEQPLSPSASRRSPFFRPGDVIALVGGEDMVVAGEYGYLELLLARALPDYHLRFRNLAWEGDTVFEQRRDLNFPTWEEQLDKIGATVVIAQFGQMECLAASVPGSAGILPAESGILPDSPTHAGRMPADTGRMPALPKDRLALPRLAEFIAAYEKLIERFSAGGERRVVLLAPFHFSQSVPFVPEDSQQFQATAFLADRNGALRRYASAIETLTAARGARFIDVSKLGADDVLLQRDGIHLTGSGHAVAADAFGFHANIAGETVGFIIPGGDTIEARKAETPQKLRQLIIAKNRLWFDYWRPQNWAFLAGDRTAQPSSRDHLDPSKRWFPPEREAFLPLIEAKEKEIDALAQKLAQP